MERASAPREMVVRLQAERHETLLELSRLTSEECRYPAQWANQTRTINFLLRMYLAHEADHVQHLHRLLADRGHAPTEAQLILGKVQALRGEMEALLLSVSDSEFEAAGPEEAWSARRITEHLLEVDAMYLRNIRTGLEQGRAQSGADHA